MNRHAMCLTLLLALSLVPFHASAEDAPVEAEAAASTTAIAIFPFQSRPKIDTRVAAAMVTKLSVALESTGKFSLLDRSAMKDLGGVLEFTRKGYIKPESAAAWGVEHSMDYVITGMVVAAGRGHGGMGVGGVRINAKAISLAIDIHFVNCATGKAVVKDTFKEEKAGVGLALGTVEFDPESRRGSEMVAIVLRRITRAILTVVNPPVVTAVDESGLAITLSYGGNVFEPGQRWELFTPGESTINPETGEQSTGKTTKCGAVRITTVEDGTTTAEVVDGVATVGAIAKFDKPGKKKKKKKKK